MIRSLLTLLIMASIFFDGLTARNCYLRNGTTSAYTSTNGIIQTCRLASITKCYSETPQPGYGDISADCSSCAPQNPDCYACDTDLCNTLTPSTISCFHRSGTDFSTNGTAKDCHTGINSCYSYVKDSLFHASCGACTSMLPADCVRCNTSFCNTVPLSTISCHKRNGTSASSTENGESVACFPGISSCYSYTHDNSRYANCGTCTSNQTSSYNCTSCNTPNCNAAAVSTISCYNRNGSTDHSNGTMMDCNPGISTCYSYVEGPSSYASCGSCTTMQVSNFGCTSCNTSSCNYKITPSNSNNLPKSCNTIAGTGIKTAVIGVLLLIMMKLF